jgi:hypothetical protein
VKNATAQAMFNANTKKNNAVEMEKRSRLRRIFREQTLVDAYCHEVLAIGLSEEIVTEEIIKFTDEPHLETAAKENKVLLISEKIPKLSGIILPSDVDKCKRFSDTVGESTYVDVEMMVDRFSIEAIDARMTAVGPTFGLGPIDVKTWQTWGYPKFVRILLFKSVNLHQDLRESLRT